MTNIRSLGPEKALRHGLPCHHQSILKRSRHLEAGFIETSHKVNPLEPEIEIGKHPSGRGYRLKASLVFRRSHADAFAFFGDAFQLELITPPWLCFYVTTPPPIEMAEGTLIDYRLKIHGLPLRWRTRIAVWDPPHRFVDDQLEGPYRWWHHEHRFEAVAGGTRVYDQVDYGVPGGWPIHGLFVRRQLRRIFHYRHATLLKLPAVRGKGRSLDV